MRQLVVYGATFNPPGLYHRRVCERLAREFDEVVVVPCGPRTDRVDTQDIEPVHRAAMADLSFGGLPRVRVELFDLEASSFTRTHELDRRWADPTTRVWHVVPDALIEGGRTGESIIQRTWHLGPEVWRRLHFVVLQRPTTKLDPGDLPPLSRAVPVDDAPGSDEIRRRAYNREPISNLVVEPVAEYIERHRLYTGASGIRTCRFLPGEPRFLVYADERNHASRELVSALPPSSAESVRMIVAVGGDGTMLRAIGEHWRRRLPFYGINTGHLGFLLNDSHSLAPADAELVLYHLPMLWVEVVRTDGTREERLAFNDAWVERASGQTAWMKLSIDGLTRMERVVADGLLVSTAAGSSAYARAMGAAPMPLNTPALLLVGSNVLDPPFWRPVVLPLSAEVEVATLDPVKRPLHAYVQGGSVGDVESMKIRVSRVAAVELAFKPEHDPSHKLALIQFPPFARS
jgi:NAD kinase